MGEGKQPRTFRSRAEEAARSSPDVVEPGFEASKVFALIKLLLTQDAQATALLTKRTRSIYQLNIRNNEGKEAQWFIDLKNYGLIGKGKATHRPDVSIWISDKDFVGVATGAQNPARLFAGGRIRFRGHIDNLVRGERIFSHERRRVYAQAAGKDASIGQDDTFEAMNTKGRRKGLFGWAKL